MNIVLRDPSHLDAHLAAMKRAHAQERPVSAETRIDRLKRLEVMIRNHLPAFVDAANTDFGSRHPVQTKMELAATIDAMKYAARNVRKWMKPKKAELPLPLRLTGARGEVYYQPLGVVGVVSPWNFPYALSLGPLAGVFSAGNRALMKLSELAPATAEAIAAAIAEDFDPYELVSAVGGTNLAQKFTSLQLDHLLFTGSPMIGRQVMRAAADNLVPVTLELGGKCPTIVDRDFDLKVAAKRILFGKSQNAGQICLAPDTVFIPNGSIDAFIEACRSIISEWFPTMRDNPDYVSMINQKALDRMHSYLAEASTRDIRIAYLGPEENLADQPHRKVALAAVVNPDADLGISRAEIFGPLMVIRGYDDLQEIVDYLDASERPLALYYFGKSPQTARFMRDRTLSGGMTINDVIVHAAFEDLPLGGVGQSGMGSYHGKAGFLAFSHAKSVYYQGRFSIMALMAPPYGRKQHKLLDRMIGK